MFLVDIAQKRVHSNEDSEILWTESNDGAFFIKSSYKVLEPPRQGVVPSRIIWK